MRAPALHFFLILSSWSVPLYSLTFIPWALFLSSVSILGSPSSLSVPFFPILDGRSKGARAALSGWHISCCPRVAPGYLAEEFRDGEATSLMKPINILSGSWRSLRHCLGPHGNARLPASAAALRPRLILILLHGLFISMWIFHGLIVAIIINIIAITVINSLITDMPNYYSQH